MDILLEIENFVRSEGASSPAMLLKKSGQSKGLKNAVDPGRLNFVPRR